MQAIRNIDPRLVIIAEMRKQLTRAELSIMDYQPSEQAIKCSLHTVRAQLQQLL